jgi:hypothetical protein
MDRKFVLAYGAKYGYSSTVTFIEKLVASSRPPTVA